MLAIWKASKVHQGTILCWEKPETAQGGQNLEKFKNPSKIITTAKDYDNCKNKNMEGCPSTILKSLCWVFS